jgi:hypothetical protein
MLVDGARQPPCKGADDGDGLGGIGDQARGGGGGYVRERGDPWEAGLSMKGRGGRIRALGRARRDMGGRWRRELDRVGVGREVRGSGGRVRGRGEVDMRKRFGRRNRSDELRRGE